MPRILLIGAGFSRNWKGWLASEIADDLARRVQSAPHVHGLLQGAPGQPGLNFESALSRLQEEARSRPSEESRRHLEVMEAAIIATFGAMNEAFKKRNRFEFSNETNYSITKFLAHFDAIFTLNQDLLLELYYFAAMPLVNPWKWSGINLPGLRAIMDGSGNTEPALLLWQPGGDYQLHTNAQPIFKLHGSTNWREEGGKHLLVMGGDKLKTISANHLLKRYAEEFERYLSMPDTRLMVVGYGFRDEHINEIIYRAWQRSKLTLFLVTPEGSSIIKNLSVQSYTPSPLEEIGIMGASSRGLDETFGGDDPGEHMKLTSFFK